MKITKSFASLIWLLLLCNCMDLDESPDPKSLHEPVVILNDAKAETSSIATILSASILKPEGATNVVANCGFLYGFKEDLSDATTIKCTLDYKGNFRANINVKEYGKVLYYKAYVSDGRSITMSDEKLYTLPPFESHLSIGEPFWDFFTSTSVNIECDFDYDEGIEIDECGFCYSSLEMPDINTSHAKSDLNHYVINTYIDDLKAGELLYVRGYAIDGENVAYGPQKLLNIYFVDLGLSVKWGTFNLGADFLEDNGDYYSWGETIPTNEYSWYYYKHSNGNNITKYCNDSLVGKIDNIYTLELIDDAANACWGGVWRIPTYDEWNELSKYCTWTWTSQHGVDGYIVTSMKYGYTDRSIFLPASGFEYDSFLNIMGYYWSSSLGEMNSRSAYVMEFDSDDHFVTPEVRIGGFSIRPVCP